MKRKKIITPDYFIGNLGTAAATEEIISCCPEDFRYEEGLVSGADLKDYKSRKCLISWLEVEKSNFIETGLKTIVQNVNKMIWNLDVINEWQTAIQFTKYLEPGDHFGWHIDNGTYKDRKLSIVYCLSKKTDYTGANFQIRKADGSVYTIKFDHGDFIVFPSETYHRVLPLKSGIRSTIVGWIK